MFPAFSFFTNAFKSYYEVPISINLTVWYQFLTFFLIRATTATCRIKSTSGALMRYFIKSTFLWRGFRKIVYP